MIINRRKPETAKIISRHLRSMREIRKYFAMKLNSGFVSRLLKTQSWLGTIREMSSRPQKNCGCNSCLQTKKAANSIWILTKQNFGNFMFAGEDGY